MNAQLLTLILIIISANGFFNPQGFLEERTIKLWFYIISTIALLFALSSKTHFPKQLKLKKWFVVLISSILVSAIMATLFHRQPLTISLTVVLGVFFAYLSYYTFIKLDVPEEQIIKFLFIICSLSVIMYICNTLTFPHEMFGGYNEIRDGEDFRGARVTVPMLNAMVVLVFYGVQKMVDNRKLIWVLPTSIFFIVIVLSLWRTTMFLTLGIALGYVVWKAKFFYKVLIILITFCFALFILPKIPIYQRLKEVSEIQVEQNAEKENIRVFDYKYFGNEAQTNDVTRVLGNGAPSLGRSQWGTEIENEWYSLGTYPVDVSWVGFYWYYGAFAVIALLILFYKSFKISKDPQKGYVRLSIIYFVLSSIANNTILTAQNIVIVTLVLYLAILPVDEKNDTNHIISN